MFNISVGLLSLALSVWHSAADVSLPNAAKLIDTHQCTYNCSIIHSHSLWYSYDFFIGAVYWLDWLWFVVRRRRCCYYDCYYSPVTEFLLHRWRRFIMTPATTRWWNESITMKGRRRRASFLFEIGAGWNFVSAMNCVHFPEMARGRRWPTGRIPHAYIHR